MEQPAILLAPMEGLLDALLREELTALGPYTLAVSEFVRVTDQLLPKRVFTRIVPELLHGGCTAAGVPVRPQLLGSEPTVLAENAARLAELNPPGIDLNFGCPAKCVNRHRGGAILLDEPELLHAIVAAVRAAVPPQVPVSAKMRLGVDDRSRLLECAQALAAGGADQIVVHARTKRDGYKPPAHWHEVARVREAVAVPVVVNGEIWTVADALAARQAAGTEALMLGRGAVADPGLAARIVAHGAAGGATGRADAGRPPSAREPVHDSTQALAEWLALEPALWRYWRRVQAGVRTPHQAGRLKQWLHYLRRRHAPAEWVYQQVRTLSAPAAFEACLREALAVQRGRGSAQVAS